MQTKSNGRTETHHVRNATEYLLSNVMNHIFEVGSSILLLILGLWATAYGYGLVGNRLVGRIRWNEGFRRPLRWLGPLLVVLCITSILVVLR